MTLGAPHMLWLMLLVPVAAGLHWRHRTHLVTGRLVGVALLRAAIVALLVVALARPAMVHKPTTQVAVIDVSESIHDRDLELVREQLRSGWQEAVGDSADERRRLVLFGRTARPAETDILDEPIDTWREGRPTQAEARGSRLAQALDLAGALIPPGTDGRVLLFTDARPTDGDAAASAFRLGRRNIELSTRLIGTPGTDDLILVAAELPVGVGAGATVPLRCVLDSARAGTAEITVERFDGRPPEKHTIQIQPGRNEQAIPVTPNGPGPQRFTVTCSADWDKDASNNRREAATWVTAPYRVRVIETSVDRAAANALRNLLGPAADVATLATERPDMNETDLLVIADTPADRLPDALQAQIGEAVDNGLGLLVTGGRQSFGPGGYHDSKLAEVLPVDFPQEIERRDPSVTLVIVIDTSGSMTGPRIDLAKEIARLAVRRLQAHDKVGIVEFYGTKRWAARIQSAANAIDINRALNRLSAGGGTVILPAIEEAYYALLNIQTRFKHVLIVTDGGVETGPFQEIISRMSEAGITSSTVMVGPGQHSTFLSSLAHWGNGRFYSAPDRFHLPEVILKQPEMLQPSPLNEATSDLAAALAGDEVLQRIDLTRAPPVKGFVTTRARPQADVVVRAASGEPLLVRWRRGRGAVAAWTSDLGGAWSADLLQWPSTAALFSQLTRQLARSSEDIRLDAIVRPGGIEVRAEWIGREGPGQVIAPLRVSWKSPSGAENQRDIEPVEPGGWNDLIATNEPGVYEITAELPEARAKGSAAVSLNVEPERPAIAPNQQLLERIEDMARFGRSAVTPEPLGNWVEPWPWLVLAAVVLLILQLAIRRWPARHTHGTTLAAVLLPIFLLGRGEPASAATTAPASAPPAATQPTAIDAADIYRQSQEAAWHGDLGRARAMLETSLATDRDGTLHAGLAQWLEMLGDDAGAIEMLKRALAMQPDSLRATAWRTRLAILLLDSDRADEAARVLSDSAGLARDDDYRRFYANLALLFGRPQIAWQLKSNGTAVARSMLIDSLAAERAGHLDEAENMSRSACDVTNSERDRRFALQQWVAIARRRGQLGPLADRLMQEQSLSPDRTQVLISVLRELNRIDDLVRLLERQTATRPSEESASERAEIREQLAAGIVESGDYRQASAVLGELVRQHPADLGWRIALARLHLVHDARDTGYAVLREALSAMREPADLFSLADAARDLAVDEVAVQAIERAAAHGPDEAFRAALWRARLAKQRGDANEAIRLLEDASRLAEDDAGRLRELAKAFEDYGRPQRAIELLQAIVARTPDEETEVRLAWLFEQTQKLAEARDVWRHLWETSTTPALQNQAGSRLLELAAKTGTVADLAIEIENKLAQGRVNAREMGLLVDLYTQIGDDLSATEVLFAFARKTGDEIGSLRQLARAYLRMGRLARTDSILQQLTAKDPAGELEYQQERAVLAVERQRPEDAIDAIQRMSAIGGDVATVHELSAGVYNLIGDHEKAAHSYEQVLNDHPQEIELWLLWANAMRSSGKTEQAIRRLTLLADQADQDDLFVVAVDGLLNLDAGRSALRIVLRRLLERIAANPERIFLYDTAADVMDTLGRSGQVNPLMEQALIFAGDQRASLLREMMERAKAANDKESHIEYGALLVGLDYDVPPQVLIDLGEVFLSQQRRAEADRAFARACTLGDYATIRRKVAEAYERALLPEPARRITAELLITDPDNVALLHSDAGLLEQLSRHADATAQYQRALRVLLGRMPSFQASAASAPGDTGANRRRVAANLDETTLFYDPTIDSLVACARDAAQQSSLLAFLNTLCGEELRAATQVEQRKSLSQFPRLARLSESLRWVAISLHQPSVAREMDRQLLALLPADAALQKTALEQWIAWGLGAQAAELAESVEAKNRPAALVAREALQEPSRLRQRLTDGNIDREVLLRLVPSLVMEGRDGEVADLLRQCRASWSKPDLDLARTMLMASIVLDDSGQTADWLGVCIDSCRTLPDSEQLVGQVQRVLRLGWNRLDEQQRQNILESLDRLAAQYNPPSTRISLLELQLQPAGSGTAESRRAALLNGATLLAADDRAIIRLLEWAPADLRWAIVEQAWTTRKPAQRFDLLLSVAGAWSWPVDAALLESLNRLLDGCPPVRLDKFTPYGTLAGSRWHRNDLQPALGTTVVEHLLSQLGTESAVRVAAACAHVAAGDRAKAVDLARQAAQAVIAGRKLEAEQARMIGDLAECFADDEILPPASASGPTATQPDASLVELFFRAQLAGAHESESQAVELFSLAFRRAPESETVRKSLIEYLERTGRTHAMWNLFEPYLADRSVMQSYEISRLAESYRIAGRPADALRVFSYDTGTLSSIRTLQLEAMLRHVDRLELILRQYLLTNRLERRFYTPLAARPVSAGGMRHYLDRKESDAPRTFTVFDVLCGIGPAMNELESLWRTATADRRDVPGLVQAFRKDIEARSATTEVLRQMEQWAKSGSLHARDLALLTSLVVESGLQLDPQLAAVLRGSLGWTDPAQADALETRARLCLQAGDPDAARAVLRWALVVDLNEGRNILDGRGPVRRMDLYLATLPETERAGQGRRAAAAWLLIPTETPNDRLDATLLRRMVRGGDQALARRALATALRCLDNGPVQAFMPSLEQACAEVLFEAGEEKSALDRVARLPRLCRMAYGELQPLDPTRFLPPANRLAEAPRTTRAVEQMIEKALESGRLGPTHATRALALLGRWCGEQDLGDAARAALSAARRTAGPVPCERWLWVIDLARDLDPAAADAMENNMKAARLLPTPRLDKSKGSAPSP